MDIQSLTSFVAIARMALELTSVEAKINSRLVTTSGLRSICTLSTLMLISVICVRGNERDESVQTEIAKLNRSSLNFRATVSRVIKFDSELATMILTKPRF